MIADKQQRSALSTESLDPKRRRLRHQQCRRKSKQIVDSHSDPADSRMLCPPRIVIGMRRRRGRSFPENPLQVTDRCCLRKAAFIQFDLISLLQRSDEIHAVYGAEI